jgi:hypothetical protein
MNAKLYLKFAGVAGRVLLAALLVTLPGQSAFAQEKGTPAVGAEANRPPANAAKAAIAQETEQEKSPESSSQVKSQEAQNVRNESSVGQGTASGNGAHEGIKVHGHWIIEVRNADGSVASHREFENAYLPGDQVLSRVLTRAISVGLWSIYLVAPSVCGDQFLALPTCRIVEPAQSSSTVGIVFRDLTVTGTPGNDSIVLSGSATATNGGAIQAVVTAINVCPSSTTPASPCVVDTTGVESGQFTTATLATPISVLSGQTIAVTVTISFS